MRCSKPEAQFKLQDIFCCVFFSGLKKLPVYNSVTHLPVFCLYTEPAVPFLSMPEGDLHDFLFHILSTLPGAEKYTHVGYSWILVLIYALIFKLLWTEQWKSDWEKLCKCVTANTKNSVSLPTCLSSFRNNSHGCRPQTTIVAFGTVKPLKTRHLRD